MSTDPQAASLPDRPNLRHLKDQAKDLLKNGGAESITDAQFKVARLYGFASWPKLKAHVDSFEEIRQLKQAIDTNDIVGVRTLMTRNPTLHSAPLGYGKDGPLTWVAECRVPWEPPSPARVAMAEWMIAHGSDVHQGGDGPLMRAALNAYRIPMMELLVSHGADVNALWHGHFPIIFAPCEALDPAALKWLLDRGANPNCRDHGYEINGYSYAGTALDYLIAGYVRSLERLSACIEVLLEAGGETRYDTPPVLTLLRGRLNDLAAMIDAEPGLLNKRFAELDCGQTGGRSLLLRGGTLLHVAAEYGNAAAVALLLDRGADVNARATVDDAGIGGQTAIFHAATQLDDAGLPVAQLLVEHGADLTIRAKIPGDYERPGEIVGCTALGYTLLFGGARTVSLLRDRGLPSNLGRREAVTACGVSSTLNPMKQRVLIVEDEEKLRRVVQLQLQSAGFDVDQAGTAEAGLKIADRADLIISDLRLPGIDGLEMLAKLRQQNSITPVIVITAFGSVETAVEAMKAGAADFLLKPFSLDHLMTVVNKALEVRALRDENKKLKEELGARYELHNMIGRSAAMQEVFGTVMRVAPSRGTVLLAGESGVGKDMIARAIHFHSQRRGKPFVKINCTALPENLMESELFGYEKGAFTGAVATKPGKFEQADTGTVFLDEIGDVPAAVQVKLLRVLQERQFERLGSNKTRQIDVRVIAATNVDLRVALENGTFREDLYYRLNVLPINIPPLRERKEDIPYLAEYFVHKLSRDIERECVITDAAMKKLMAYDWPGNVRELENVIERSIVLCGGSELTANDIKLDATRNRPSQGLGFLPDGMSLDEHEQSIIREALRRANGNKSQAARLLGITRNALRYRLSQMGLDAGPGE